MNNTPSQNQTKFSIILFCILVAAFFITMAVVTFIVFNENNITQIAKEKAQKIIESPELLEDFLDSFFEKYEINENKNKFYLKNSKWKKYNYKTRKNLLDTAAILSSKKRKEYYNDQYYTSKENELPRTKIHSIETDQLLAEYIPNNNTDKSSTFEDIKAELKAYNFYDTAENYKAGNNTKEEFQEENSEQTNSNSNKGKENPVVQNPTQPETQLPELVRTQNTEEFMNKVTKKIKANWNPSGYDKSLKAVVLFKILDDGTVENPTIVTSSGNEDFDNFSIKTIVDLRKIEPLSQDLVDQGRDSVEIKFSFDFNYYPPTNN